MVLLLLIGMFIFVAMLAPKFALAALAITLVLGLVIKYVTGWIAGEVTLLQSIKAVFFSLLLNILTNVFAAQALSGLGSLGNILGQILVFAASIFAFSLMLEIPWARALAVAAVFWLLAFPILLFLGVSASGITWTRV